MKRVRQPLDDRSCGGESPVSDEEAAMLDEAIAEADADPNEGMLWDDVRRQLHELSEEEEAELEASHLDIRAGNYITAEELFRRLRDQE
jgi:hypothetical protein